MLQLSLALAIPLFFVLARAGFPVNITFPSQPPPEAQYNVVRDNFIGISWELSSFDTLCMCSDNRYPFPYSLRNTGGKSVDAQPNAMQNYLHNLVVRLSNPLRIRVGGNSMDGCDSRYCLLC